MAPSAVAYRTALVSTAGTPAWRARASIRAAWPRLAGPWGAPWWQTTSTNTDPAAGPIATGARISRARSGRRARRPGRPRSRARAARPERDTGRPGAPAWPPTRSRSATGEPRSPLR